jgi:HSP20 family molecular chaperone IbpA
MIREIGETIGNTVVETVGRAVGRAQEGRPLPVDLLESDDAYLAVFDAPGAVAGDVQVRFEDRTLQVRVDRFREFHEGFEMRFPGRGLALDGEVELPAGASVDPSGATSTLKDNGTLHVRVPKREDEADGAVEMVGDDGEATDDDHGHDDHDTEETREHDADAEHDDTDADAN